MQYMPTQSLHDICIYEHEKVNPHLFTKSTQFSVHVHMCNYVRTSTTRPAILTLLLQVRWLSLCHTFRSQLGPKTSRRQHGAMLPGGPVQIRARVKVLISESLTCYEGKATFWSEDEGVPKGVGLQKIVSQDSRAPAGSWCKPKDKKMSETERAGEKDKEREREKARNHATDKGRRNEARRRRRMQPGAAAFPGGLSLSVRPCALARFNCELFCTVSYCPSCSHASTRSMQALVRDR